VRAGIFSTGSDQAHVFTGQSFSVVSVVANLITTGGFLSVVLDNARGGQGGLEMSVLWALSGVFRIGSVKPYQGGWIPSVAYMLVPGNKIWFLNYS